MPYQIKDPAIERIGPILLKGIAVLAALTLAIPLGLTVLSQFLF